MAKHEPTVVWLGRPIGTSRNCAVSTVSEEDLRIEIDDDGISEIITINRSLARLLAKRILECLEATK